MFLPHLQNNHGVSGCGECELKMFSDFQAKGWGKNSILRELPCQLKFLISNVLVYKHNIMWKIIEGQGYIFTKVLTYILCHLIHMHLLNNKRH